MREFNEVAYMKARKLCVSPIEQQLLPALLNVRPLFLENLPGCILTNHPEIRLKAQHKVGRYTTDFALWIRPRKTPVLKLAIECDGHEFHDGSKEAAARDKKRNIHFDLMGWKMARFSGRMINASPVSVVSQIEDLIDSHYANLIRSEAELQWREAS